MSQFASTLYPKTNPTNAALLKFREIRSVTGNAVWIDAYLFSEELLEDGYRNFDPRQWQHAMDVLLKILSVFKRTG